MSSYEVAVAKHATLAGTSADSVTLTGKGKTVGVTNRDTATEMFFTFDSTATAVSAANDTFVVLPQQTKFMELTTDRTPVVSIVGSSNPYSIELH